MENSTDRRQQIYDEIKASSRQEFILKEMKRLGFWDEGVIDFDAANKYFAEERKLSQELQKLVKEKQIFDDPEAFLAQKHQERKKASRLSQQETKERRERQRIEKAEKWAETKEKDIIYLGEGYSHQLNDNESNVERLRSFQLPILHTAADLAKAMKITIGELRFLAFSRKNSKISHYKRFEIPKKTGGYRLISAPMPRLKQAQHWILESILNEVDTHPKAHGCVIGKSIKTNAEPHVNQAVVINQDFQNFFPSITYNRIKGVFLSFGYSHQLATIFALLTSEPKILDITLLGEDYYAQRGSRFLPQGAPTSPAITNILCRKLDARLDGLAQKLGFTYSRYVDDITFSGGHAQFGKITSILKYSKRIVKEENFKLHPDKLRVMKRNNRQEVTGVVVNEKPNVPKKTLKKFRALLFQIEKDGIEGKFWNKKGNVLAQIDGFANFIYQIDPEKGRIYKARVGAILTKYDYKTEQRKLNPIPKSASKSTRPRQEGLFSVLKKKISRFFRR